MKAKNEGKNSDNIFCYFRKKKNTNSQKTRIWYGYAVSCIILTVINCLMGVKTPREVIHLQSKILKQTNSASLYPTYVRFP